MSKFSGGLQEPGPIHWLGVRLIRLWLLISGSRVTGAENMPDTGACIICANHLKFMDPFFIGSVSPRAVRFVSKKENFDGAFLEVLMRLSLAIELDREHPKPSQIKEIMGVLRGGGALGIFPEGTRNRVGGLLEFHDGASTFSRKLGAPLIPVHITWRGAVADISVGTAIYPDSFESDEALTAALRKAIEALA